VPIGHLQNGKEQISADHVFDGLIWRLRITRRKNNADPEWYTLKTSIKCDGDGSSEMWRTEAKMEISFKRRDGILDNCGKVSHSFASWKGDGNRWVHMPKLDCYYSPLPSTFDRILAFVVIETDSESFARRPILDLRSPMNDVILVVKGQTFPVN
ncbi:hypothetical protein PENTCL1PPCAC_13187, partial [Pristionchus entomophagus]